MAAELATAYIALVPTTRGIQSQLQRDLVPAAAAAGDEAGDKAGKNFASSFGNATRSITKVGAIISAVALTAGGALATLGIKSAASLEQTTTSFTALLGSSKAATQQIALLQKYAAATPFSQQDVLGYAQQYYTLANSVGLSKAQLIPFLDAVGNLGAVTGASTENIHNAVMAIGQIGSSGKVTLDNLNQISEAFPGFNGAAAIATATGQSTADVMKQISAGTLDAATGVQALLVGMQKFPGAAGAMAKQSQTLNGLFSTFTDTIKISLTTAFKPLIPVVKNSLTQLTPIIATTLRQVAPVIASFVKNLAPVLGPLIRGLGTALGAVFRALGPALKAVAPVIRPLANAFAAIARAVTPIITLFARIIAQVGPPLLDMLVAIARALTPIVTAFAQALEPVLPVIEQAIRGLTRALTPVITQLVNALAPVLPIIANAFTQILITLTPVIKALANGFSTVIAEIAPDLPDIAKALASMGLSFAQILVAIAPLIKPLAQLLGLILKFQVPQLLAIAKAMQLFATAVSVASSSLQTFPSDLIKNITGQTGNLIGTATDLTVAMQNLGKSTHITGSIDVIQVFDGLNAVINAVIPGFGAMQNAAHLVATIDVSQIFAALNAVAGLFVPGLSFAGPLAALGARLANTPDPSVGSSGGGGFKVPTGGGGAPASGGSGATAPTKAKPPKFDKSTLTGFLKSLKGSTAEVRAAFAEIVKSGRQSKTFSDQLIATLQGENTRLLSLVTQRNHVAKLLANAQAHLADLRQKRSAEISTVQAATTGTFQIASSGTGFNGQQPVTFNNILAQVKQAVVKATKFTAALKRLRREGLGQGLLRQLAEAGPDALPQALALLRATPKQIGLLNKQVIALSTQGKSLGTFVGNDMYNAGIASAQGLIKGLNSQENALVLAVKKLAEKMVAQIKKSLGIHSPSLVMRGVGQYTGQGFALGIGDTHKAVQAQADRLANAAIPSAQLASWSGTGGRQISDADLQALAEIVSQMSIDARFYVGQDQFGRAVAKSQRPSSAGSRAGGYQ